MLTSSCVIASPKPVAADIHAYPNFDAQNAQSQSEDQTHVMCNTIAAGGKATLTKLEVADARIMHVLPWQAMS